MAHQYSITLVVISYLVAVAGSLMALIMTRDAHENPDSSGSLVSLGALCLGGVGIWSMHFIGMTAFSIPNMNIGYDFGLTTLSLFIGIGVVYIGLRFIAGDFSFGRLIPAAIFVGLGVAAMHYTGMLAIQIQADISWDWNIIIISIVIAIIAALVALWLTAHVKLLWQVVLSALVMGVAVCGMHYTGMMAASFLHNINLPVVQATNTAYFIMIIGGIDAIILIIAMMVAISEKKVRSISRF